MPAVSSQGPRGIELKAVLAALIATGFAWQVLSRACASLLVQAEQPVVALALRPSDGAALTSLAALAIARRADQNAATDDVKASNAKAARDLADAALTTAPLDPSALRLLAQAADMTGDKPRAEKLMRAAGRQTIRDSIVEFYLLTLYASRKDYMRALDQADALLRISPEFGEQVYPVLDKVATDPDAQAAFIEVLRTGPPWRGNFLASVAAKIDKPDNFLDVIIALKEGASPLKDTELRVYLDPLIARGLVNEAHDAWLQLLPPNRLSNLKYVYNGGFDFGLTNLPFDWTIKPIDGATITLSQIPDEDDRGLAIQFDGKRTAFRNVVQLLTLPVGSYKLTGSYRTNALNNPRGMTWRLYCAQRNDSVPIAQTDRVSGTSGGWKDFETTFDIPDDRCSAQWLRLELASRVSIEETVSGSVWYNNIQIAKSDGSTAQPEASGIRMPEQPGTKFERAIRKR